MKNPSPVLDVMDALNPLRPSIDVLVVDRGVPKHKIVVAERTTLKRALADIVELCENGLTIGGDRVDIKKIVLRGNKDNPRRMYTLRERCR